MTSTPHRAWIGAGLVRRCGRGTGVVHTLIGKLHTQGMEVIDKPDRASMKAKLGEFYSRWKSEFGPTVWGLLEGYTGKLG